MEDEPKVKAWRPQILVAMVFLTLIAIIALVLVAVMATNDTLPNEGWIAVGVLSTGVITIASAIASLGLKIIESETTDNNG